MLKVNEIFYSIQGESSYAGHPCVFIRLTGCNLRCTYCDTKYAYKKGTKLSIKKIIDQVNQYECPLVEITGGEPLIQKGTPQLIDTLTEKGFQVLAETNGTLDISLLKNNIIRIVDIKCPGSGENDKTDWNNIDRLISQDEVKFVLSSQADYEWAKNITNKYQLIERAKVLFSPVQGKLDLTNLARWILEDHLNIRLQPQLHNIMWSDNRKGK